MPNGWLPNGTAEQQGFAVAMVDAGLAVEMITPKMVGRSPEQEFPVWYENYLKGVKEEDAAEDGREWTTSDKSYMEIQIKASLPDLLTVESRLKLAQAVKKEADEKEAADERERSSNGKSEENVLSHVFKKLSKMMSSAPTKTSDMMRLARDDAASKQVRQGFKKYLLTELNSKLAGLGTGTQVVMPGTLKYDVGHENDVGCETNVYSMKQQPAEESLKERASFSICVLVRLKVQKQTRKTLEQARRDVEKVLSSDTRELLVGGNRSDSALRLWQFPAWSDDDAMTQCISLLGHARPVSDCSFAPGNAAKAISCDESGRIICWDNVPQASDGEEMASSKVKSRSVTVPGAGRPFKVALSHDGSRALSMEQVLPVDGSGGEGCLRVWNVSEFTATGRSNAPQPDEHPASLREYALPDAVSQPGCVGLDASSDGTKIVMASGKRVELFQDKSKWHLHDGGPSPEGMWLTVDSEHAALRPAVSLASQIGGTVSNAQEFMNGDDPTLLYTRVDGSRAPLPVFSRTAALLRRYPHLIFEPDSACADRTLVHKTVTSGGGCDGRYDGEDPSAGTTMLPLLELLVQLSPGCSLLAGSDNSKPKRMKPYDLLMARVLTRSRFWADRHSADVTTRDHKTLHKSARTMFFVGGELHGSKLLSQNKVKKHHGHAFWYGDKYGYDLLGDNTSGRAFTESSNRLFREESMLVMRLLIEDDWLPFVNRPESTQSTGGADVAVVEVPAKVPRVPIYIMSQQPQAGSLHGRGGGGRRHALEDSKWVDSPQNRLSAKVRPPPPAPRPHTHTHTTWTALQ